jgi:TorA maturation chaperone TorD
MVRWLDERGETRITLGSCLSYQPSEEQVAAAAAKLREAWDETEEQRRSHYPTVPVETPEVVEDKSRKFKGLR